MVGTLSACSSSPSPFCPLPALCVSGPDGEATVFLGLRGDLMPITVAQD